jgi:predicted kinase
MNKRNELLFLIGASGSGKSRFTSKMTEHITVSSDKIRKELFNTLEKQEKADHQLVFNELHNRIDDSIQIGDVIYDATNLNRKKRKYFYNTILPKMSRKVDVRAVIFVEPFSVIKQNNKSKDEESQVPFDALMRMYQTVQIPRVGVDCDDIIVKGETNFFIPGMTYTRLLNVNSLREFIGYVGPEYRKEMKNLFGPHDTPYHLESIEEHINMCIENAGDDKVLKITAIFHDLGKSITKNGGRYFNHQFVSAMYALKAFSEVSDMPEDIKTIVLEVIYQHMNAHNGLTEKTEKSNNLDTRTIERGLVFK